MSEAEYLICKNGMYYRPNAQGYTGSIAEAGRYTLDEAIRHSHPNGPDGPRDSITYALAPAMTEGPDLTGCPILALVAGYADYKAISDDRWEQGKAAGYRELGEMVAVALTPSALSGVAAERRMRPMLDPNYCPDNFLCAALATEAE